MFGTNGRTAENGANQVLNTSLRAGPSQTYWLRVNFNGLFESDQNKFRTMRTYSKTGKILSDQQKNTIESSAGQESVPKHMFWLQKLSYCLLTPQERTCPDVPTMPQMTQGGTSASSIEAGNDVSAGRNDSSSSYAPCMISSGYFNTNFRHCTVRHNRIKTFSVFIAEFSRKGIYDAL